MTYSLADYDDCVNLLKDASLVLGGDVLSILLYGSLAIGTVKPGASDVLDAIVIVADDVIDDEQKYERAMGVFSTVCVKIACKGLPFHPFHYYSRTEFAKRYPAFYQRQWITDGYSKVASGLDVRTEITGSDYDWKLLEESYFAQRLLVQRIAHYIANPDSIIANKSGAFAALANFVRFSPRLACVTLGEHVVEQQMLAALTKHIPSLDTESLTSLREMAKSESGTADDISRAMELALSLSEALHASILALKG